MDRLRRFILESAFTEDFSKAVYDALGIFEAVSINKNFLVQAAGSPDALREVKARVNGVWADAHMDGVVRGGNVLQKLFNFLYLMEIRKPGFVNLDLLSKIHDVAIHGSLDQKFLSRVDSDTQPEAALVILDEARASAAQAAKPYPELSDDDEKVWNRVKVYHEFPDGFKWVYAIDQNGRVAGYMPSRITGKTMNHCGNEPSCRTGDEYWELRDGRGKAYLTVILNGNGEIEESKSWGNQVNKYRLQILPYVKWFLKDQKVTGVGIRYDEGYATHMNFGVKDFIGDDPEFIDYVLDNKETLLGNTESRILFWQNALAEGLVTVDELKSAYMSGINRSAFFRELPALAKYANTAKFKIRDGKYDPPDSMFGANSFSVLCAACSGNPFTEAELVDMISERKLQLEVFANYNIKLLTPELQRAFVRANAENLSKLIEISNQVAAFKVAPSIWKSLLPTEDEVSGMDRQDSARNRTVLDRCVRLMYMVDNANPPSKMAGVAQELMTNGPFLSFVYTAISMTSGNFDDMFGTYVSSSLRPIPVYGRLASILGKFPDMPLPAGYEDMHARLLGVVFGNDGRKSGELDGWGDILSVDIDIGGPRNERLLGQYTDSMISGMLQSTACLDEYENVKRSVALLCRAFTCERISAISDDTVTSGNIASLGAMATIMPKTDEMFRTARKVVEEYFYRKHVNTGRYEWKIDTSSWGFTEKPIHIIVFDLLGHWNDLLRILDWDDARTYGGMNTLICMFRHYRLEMPKTEVEPIVVYLVNELRKPEHVSYATNMWEDRAFPKELMRLVTRYGIDSRPIPEFFREMSDLACEHDDRFDYVGAWSIYTIPFDEWEEEYSKYGFNFVNGYVLQAPADTMYANEFIPNFICDKILDKAWGGIGDLIRKVQGTRCKSCLAKTISKRIVNGNFPLEGEDGEHLFNILYDNKLINAEAYRAAMGRREDRGVVAVENTETAGNVLKAFTSIQRLDTLPELVAATFKYLVDTLYANMGDGRYRWKVDENAYTEACIVGAFSAKLASKATTGMVPKAIKKLYDDGLVERLRNFPVENRAACDTPNKPKSKITCVANREINDALYALDRVKDSAFAAADKPAKPTRRRKAVSG